MRFDEMKRRRMRLKMTQAETAAAAGISVPTLQNIEAGRANPSLETLTGLLKVLGLRLEFVVQEPDWDGLIAYGLPTTRSSAVEEAGLPRRSPGTLAERLKSTALAIESAPGAAIPERLVEAFQALLVAIQTHFPSYYRTRLEKSEAVRRIYPKVISGRIIKLKRLALPILCEYL